MIRFFEKAQRLSYIDRCSNTPHIKDYSVAQHSFYIAFYAMLFADLENDRGEKYDTSEVIKKALLHDLEESITGDVLFPVHNSHPRFKEKLDEIRKGVVNQQLFSELPLNLRKYYIMLWEDAKDDTKEGRLIACMDKFEILLFAYFEVKLGNKQFIQIYENAKHIIVDTYNIPSVTEAIESIESDKEFSEILYERR